MVLQIQDDDALDLAAIKCIFGELVFAPIDALLELANIGKLSKPAAYSATLSILNSVPEFIAKCHGEKGCSPTITDWNLKHSRYLYVYGIYKLNLISEEIMITPSFEDHAEFLYEKLRCDIAHSMASGNVQFYKDMQGEHLGHFSFYANDPDNGDFGVREIAGFSCYLPNVYKKVREGVENYIANIESGEEQLHLKNAKDDFMYIPGLSGSLEREFGFVSLLEKIHDYFPENFPRQ